MLPRTVDSLYLDSIDVENSTCAPVLCVHGLFAGAWAFERFLPLIAGRGYPATALSFRGHPPNSPDKGIGRLKVTDYARDAATVAERLGRPIVIGHSLGGLVALMMAARNRVRAAVLIAPAPPRGITVLSPGLLMRMTTYVPAMILSRPFLPSASHLDALVLNRMPEQDRPVTRSRFVADSGRAARQITLGVYKIPSRAVRVPLLVVGAELDRFIPVRVAERIARKYDGTFHVARGHGHFLLGEPGWEQQAKTILDWIDALPRIIREVAGEVSVRSPLTNLPRAARIDSGDVHRPAHEGT